MERSIIFAAFHNNGVALSHSVTGLKKRQSSTYHNRGILFSSHHDVGAHTGCGSLSIGSCNAQCIFIVLHYRTPCLSTFKHGNSKAACSNNLGVIVMYSCGSYNKINTVINILAPFLQYISKEAFKKKRGYWTLRGT